MGLTKEGIGVAVTGSLALRGLTITPPLALAPMVGLSHSALRTLVVEEGGAGLLFTEMLAARKLPQESDQASPYLIRGPEERPLFYQLFLTEKEDIAPAVDRLHQLDAQGIDLNLGCPAPQLRRHGAGVFLTADPHTGPDPDTDLAGGDRTAGQRQDPPRRKSRRGQAAGVLPDARGGRG